MLRDREKDTHTDMLIAILRSPIAGRVITKPNKYRAIYVRTQQVHV